MNILNVLHRVTKAEFCSLRCIKNSVSEQRRDRRKMVVSLSLRFVSSLWIFSPRFSELTL